MASTVQLALSRLALGFLRMVMACVGQKVTHRWQLTQFSSLLTMVSVSGVVAVAVVGALVSAYFAADAASRVAFDEVFGVYVAFHVICCLRF